MFEFGQVIFPTNVWSILFFTFMFVWTVISAFITKGRSLMAFVVLTLVLHWMFDTPTRHIWPLGLVLYFAYAGIVSMRRQKQQKEETSVHPTHPRAIPTKRAMLRKVHRGDTIAFVFGTHRLPHR